MSKSMEPITGVTTDRATTASDMIKQARERQAEQIEADRLRMERPNDVDASVTEDKGADLARDLHKPQARPYRVILDPETSRLSTEVIDTATGKVIQRIPPGYVDPEDLLNPEAGAKASEKDIEL